MGPEGRGAGQDGAEGGRRTPGSSARSREGSLRGGPSQGLPSAPATHSPCRVRKSRPESMPVARRRGEGERGGSGALRGTRRRRPRVRAERRGEAQGLRWEEAGGGPGTPPRPLQPPAARAPAPPVHQPASLPACPGGREGGPRSGLGSPPSPGPRRVDAPRPEIASALPLPPPLPPPAAGPVITEGGPAPRPARGRLPGLGAMLPGTWRHPREGQRPVRAQASSRRAPQVCSPLRKTGAQVPRSSERTPGTCPEEGPLPPAGKCEPQERLWWGLCGAGRGGKLTARECRELTFETPSPRHTPATPPKLLAVVQQSG